MSAKNKKVGVLMGGLSREREISLRSGCAVASALRTRGYNVVEIDVGRTIAERIVRDEIEVAFVALHGRYGEDGTIQGLLEMIGIPYTGSGPLGSAIGIDKIMTKIFVAEFKVRTPRWVPVEKSRIGDVPELPADYPVIVKPNREGSTLGMTIVKNSGDLPAALREAATFDDLILVEEYIRGTEVTVGILNGKALPVLEVVPRSGFYDYAAKYTKGMTEYIVPARIPEKIARRVSETSESLVPLLRLSGFARVDFIVSPTGEDYFLEVNTIPGMTETSLVPKAAAAAGISFEDLCEQILAGASLKV